MSEVDINKAISELEGIRSNKNAGEGNTVMREVQISCLNESQEMSTLADSPSEEGLSLRLIEDLDTRGPHGHNVRSGKWIHDTSRWILYLRVTVILLFITMAPSLTTFLVRAVGFTKVGIKAGSIAAEMMAVAAKTSGCRGPARGGIIATLQSIGASGLGLMGSIIAMVVATFAVIVTVKCRRRWKH